MIEIIFNCTTLADFKAAVDFMDARRGLPSAGVHIEAPNVAPTASQSVPRVETAEERRGPLETQYVELIGKRMHIGSDDKARFTSREDYAKHKLEELDRLTGGDDEKGETYEPGELPEPEDVDTSDF